MIYTKKNQHGLALSELERGDDAGVKKRDISALAIWDCY